MSTFERVWLMVVMILCAFGIPLNVYLLSAYWNAQRRKAQEEMRRHLQKVTQRGENAP